MKKILICFLSVLTIYHFLYSSIFSVYAFDDEEITLSDDCCYVPDVHNNSDLYSASAALGSLGSLTLGGVGVTVAPATVAGVALGVVTVGLGSYVVYKGISNLVNVGYGFYEDYLNSYKINNVMDIKFDVNGNMVFTALKDTINNISSHFMANSYKQKYSYVDEGNLFSDSSSFDHYTLINDLSNVTVQSFFVKSTSQGEYPGLSNSIFVAPTGFHFKYTYQTSSGDFVSLFAEKIKLSVDSTGKTLITGYKNEGNFFKLVHSTNSMTLSTSSFGSVYSYLDDGVGLQWKLNGKNPTGKLDNYEMNLSKIFSAFGVTLTNASHLYDEREIFSNPVTHDYVISKDYIQTLNPDLTFENGSWLDSKGEKVDPYDVTVPLGNVMNPDGSISFDETLDSVLTGSSDTVTPDDTVPPSDSLPDINFDSIIGFLSSILDWLFAFPSWLISNLVDVIVGAIDSVPKLINEVLSGISSAINKTWEWCQGLPNLLGDLLGALGQAIIDGLTLAFSGVISGIQTIVDFFTGILDFIMSLVIPANGFFTSELSKLRDVFNSKFPFFSQINDILNAFKFDINSPLPEFKITMPIKYGGQTYSVINFAHFVSYRQYILNFVRLFTWIPFLIRIYKKSMYMATGK